MTFQDSWPSAANQHHFEKYVLVNYNLIENDHYFSNPIALRMAKTVVLAILSAKGLRNYPDLKSHFVQTTFWFAMIAN